MAQAPETTGAIYSCCYCKTPRMTIRQIDQHNRRNHPETITTR